MLTGKRLKFVDEYLKDFNGTQAAISAGFSAKTATVTASKLLASDEVSAEIKRRLDQINSGKIATLKETLETMTRVMRGEVLEEIPLAIPGKGYEVLKLPPKIKDRLSAATALHKILSAAADETTDHELKIVIIKAGEGNEGTFKSD